MKTQSRLVSCLALTLVLTFAGCSGSDSNPAVAPETDSATDSATGSVPPLTSPADRPSLTAKQVVEGRGTFHAYTDQFYRGDLDALFEKFSPEMKQTMPLDQLNALYAEVKATYGDQVKVITEQQQENEEYRGFARFARFDKHDGVIEVKWILRKDDTIAGLFVRPIQADEMKREPVLSRSDDG